MKFLIPTEPDDTHAILVKIALETLGHRVSFLFTADHPTLQKNSVFIDNQSYQWQSVDDDAAIFADHYDVVWWRRARKPYVPKASIHPDDYAFVSRENQLFYESFTENLAPNAWWVNTKASANRANFKLLQLKIASECKMIIPTTLCSNDPDEIRSFMSQHADVGVIYKPLCADVWYEENQMKLVYTSRIQAADLPSSGVLQRTPGIFQHEVKKKYELRVTCFGDYLVAAKLHSQPHVDGQVDWRAIREGRMLIEPYTLPMELANKIRLFMREIGIVFGSFDFIVTPDDEFIFLEVNEQGQFLWMEDYNPSFKMLDIFVNFLLNQSVDFTWEPTGHEHVIEQYRSEIEPVYSELMRRHVVLNCANVR